MKKGSYKITNKLGSRQSVGIGGERYEFEVGEVKTLSLYPYEAEVFSGMSEVFSVVELEAGEDPPARSAAEIDTEVVLYRRKKGLIG